MKILIPSLASGALALAAAVSFAQGPGSGPGPMADRGMGGHHRMDCSRDTDPAKCEARRKEFRDQMRSAYDACKDKTDRRACMTEQMCSRAQDPAKCNEQAKERHTRMGQRMEERQKMHEACTGKRGDELQKCLGDQHRQHRGTGPGPRS